jgi:hypothetical protein
MSDRRQKIDRLALVGRHNVTRTQMNYIAPLQVGNGNFAFGADITGLQTFAEFITMSDWGWHSFPLPSEETPESFHGTAWNAHGRAVMYESPNSDQKELGQWMYENPHRVNLGRIALSLLRSDGEAATSNDITDSHQVLDLWSGVLSSHFVVDGQAVHVQTSASPIHDAVAVRIRSPLIAQGRLSLFVDFPYDDGIEFNQHVGDWVNVHKHQTTVVRKDSKRADIKHILDEAIYYASISWQSNATFTSPSTVGPQQTSHRYYLNGSGNDLDVLVAFSPTPLPDNLPTVAETFCDSASFWEDYWTSGGVIDLSESSDDRWFELERRIVLSQYLMRVNEAGSLPPQESGYVNNGWQGKFHMEMYWWHAAHWALWNHWPELDRSMTVYKNFLSTSKARASKQGYRGARWPKMTGPEGRESVHPCNAMLIWQQPHPMFFAELDYQAHPTLDTLEKWREILFETADFMASYPVFDVDSKKYVLGPPMYVVSENTEPTITINPTFELSYWRFGLRIAQTWCERLDIPRNEVWDKVYNNLAPLPVQDGAYVLYEGVNDMWTKFNFEHPALVGVYGWLPGDGVDPETMRVTVDIVTKLWNLEHVWGWDLPVLAMSAARLGETERAVDLLATKRSHFDFDDAGLSTGGPYPYFPSNGGLLYAVALMAAGWPGAPNRDTPGFPDDGSWVIRSEGLARAL